jgi:DNA-binding response OmpR family regulator
MRILAVDPNSDFLEILGFMLRRDGHEVIFAHDEAGALRQFATRRPDLVLAETRLSAGSGWALSEAVRAAGTTPFLFLAGSRGEDDPVRARELGADGYLNKPFSPRVLRDCVEAAARRRSLAAPRTAVAGEFGAGERKLDAQRQCSSFARGCRA